MDRAPTKKMPAVTVFAKLTIDPKDNNLAYKVVYDLLC